VLDTAFPDLLSAFRIAEFNQYLEQIPDTEVHSLGKLLFDKRSFRQKLDEYERAFPMHKGRVRMFNPYRRLVAKLAYTVFINNAFRFLDVLERDKVPFIFTLYPGGGFRLDNQDSDAKLKRVFSSSSFRHVIVTQKVTRDYLISRGLCPAERIQFIWGGVLPPRTSADVIGTKIMFGRDKDTLDVCFVAWKYMPGGLDKGYDVFVEVAKKVSKDHNDICFHVVGPYDKSDWDVTGANIRFHGPKKTPELEKFFKEMDIIVSPNAPFILAPGAFDGFPTGACVEAGLSGVIVVCTDPFGENEFFTDQEIIIVSRDSEEIRERIIEFYQNPARLYEFSKRGTEAFQRIFGLERQMTPRLALLQKYIFEN
jgi:glycosyltransferase involved in cell wall biosynthesis